MSNYAAGHHAEKVAAEYLANEGYNILAQNWKLPQCEIDIVASKDGVMFMIEVKYRKTANQGTGLDYITTKKLSQMRFAAENWVQQHSWQGPYQLAVIAMSGDYRVEDFVQDI